MRRAPPLLALLIATLLAGPGLAQEPGSGPSAGSAPPAAPALPEAKPQEAQQFVVGKWPEGLVLAGDSLWVAESGQRVVAEVSRTGQVKRRIKIGRLPVGMGVGPDGQILAQVHTDQRLKQINPKTGKVKEFKPLPDGPEDLAVAGGHAFSLLWFQNSSAGASVLRVNLATGHTQRSADIGKNAFSLAVCNDRVFVARDGQVVVLDTEKLLPQGTAEVGGHLMHVACAGSTVVAAAGEQVARVDPGNHQVTHRVGLPLRVAALAAFDDAVLASTVDGTLWVLAPDTLAVKHRLSAAAPYQAHGLVREGREVWLTAHDGGEVGTLVRVTLPE